MKITINNIKNSIGLTIVILMSNACNIPYLGVKNESNSLPSSYKISLNDSANSALLKWNDFFKDSNLMALIDTALMNNQELNIMMEEIKIARNDVKSKKGEYLPFVSPSVAVSNDKVGRYTSRGANDANTDIMPGRTFPEPLGDYMVALNASWEIDIWKKMRNARQAAIRRYLATNEGKNFMLTNLIAEITYTYYELMALDNQLEILKKNIEIQQNALEFVKLEKASAKVTELAVRKFEAEVLKNQSRQHYIQQAIIETENKINFLVGRFPQPVKRNSTAFIDLETDSIKYGIPAQLLQNRPDIRQAELMLVASKLDVLSAKASFYPSLRLKAGLGYQAFNPSFLLSTPESMIYSLAGDLVAPLINRNAIKAQYRTANSKQIQAVFNYQKTVLNAYIEVVNQLAKMDNLSKSYEYKAKQVNALTQSIDISIVLFKSARADYMEVLLTQRDALESKFELIETKLLQMNAKVNIYRALGGGWR
ncbi:MAG: TolC family protein [Bacteroidia bacterium]|nr:TolC family protein [Bacteroidia bacterium]